MIAVLISILAIATVVVVGLPLSAWVSERQRRAHADRMRGFGGTEGDWIGRPRAAGGGADGDFAGGGGSGDCDGGSSCH